MESTLETMSDSSKVRKDFLTAKVTMKSPFMLDAWMVCRHSCNPAGMGEPEGLHFLLGRKQRAGEWIVGRGRAGLVIEPAAKHGKTPGLPGRGNLTSIFPVLCNGSEFVRREYGTASTRFQTLHALCCSWCFSRSFRSYDARRARVQAGAQRGKNGRKRGRTTRSCCVQRAAHGVWLVAQMAAHWLD